MATHDAPQPMDNTFWLQRWQAGHTGFHQSRIMPLLQKYWPRLGLAPGSLVLVPLAGKSLDVGWLAQQGHRVRAIELSAVAVEQFFDEHHLTPERQQTDQGTWYRSGRIEYFCGDIFALPPAVFEPVAGCYDRAALIALTPELRRRYVHHVYQNLPQDCQTLLLTLDYPQHEMDGPPFSVSAHEVHQHFAARWAIERLETRDVLAHEPKFASRGVTRMQTEVYRLRKPAP